jgi:hypothetical protein
MDDFGTVMSDDGGDSWTVGRVGAADHPIALWWDGKQLILDLVASSSLYSTNGYTWTRVSYPTQGQKRDAVWTGSQWISVYRGQVFTSPDREIWTLKNSGGEYPGLYKNPWAWTGSRVVLVGWKGLILTWSATPETFIVPSQPGRPGFALRFSAAGLVATLPDAMVGTAVRGAVFRADGAKVLEFPAARAARELVLSTEALPRGGYFLRLSNGPVTVAEGFALTR